MIGFNDTSQEMGVEVWMDDILTSVSYLKRLLDV